MIVSLLLQHSHVDNLDHSFTEIFPQSYRVKYKNYSGQLMFVGYVTDIINIILLYSQGSVTRRKKLFCRFYHINVINHKYLIIVKYWVNISPAEELLDFCKTVSML